MQLILDVRSPSEYIHAHIPNATTFPIFSDEERKVIGTAYKQEGKKRAIKLGLDYFGVKMRGMVEDVEKMLSPSKVNLTVQEGGTDQATVQNQQVYIYCWRGGMRSATVAWLLDLYGFDVCLLEGGYKAYRNWALAQFEKDYEVNILGGYTGSGKTAILEELDREKIPMIDLEGIANHKGSAFGGIGQPDQPSQEMFENELAAALAKNQHHGFWLEDESQRIGRLHIPHTFWDLMRKRPVYFIEIPFFERLQYIAKEYGICDRQQLVLSIERIKKRLGPLETKMAIAHLNEGDVIECFRILLHYYDKLYEKGLNSRENISKILNKIPCLCVDSKTNKNKLLVCSTVNLS